MPKSIRIRTEPGVDRNINVKIDQDFDSLEILSLKLRQEDLYTQFCADYGVVVGRVVANGGIGIPNAHVSIFIPLDKVDEDNPIISTLYPYKSPTSKNEDGYRYNLLPYEDEYYGHNATGTFPTVDDVLTRKEVLQVYEKYYKYSVRTNDSGDFMIVGVPLGGQKIVMDLDLSNMGEFSLRPSDLIRMGRGVPSQFNGQLFKDSENIDSLPQILHEIKDIDVTSFWGQDEMCDVGITRVDFDLSDQGVEILPHSSFMGSIFSSNESDYITSNCRPKKDTGNLCDAVVAPGEILAIRQTIQEDENGDPVLEQYRLEDGGNVIDDNGAWLIDLPMNMNFVTTNEFGERVTSVDPKVGVPTESKYRFKIKWQNEAGLQSQIMRANYLIPNIKEHWGSDTPDDDGALSNLDFNKSYSFSLDWADYYDKDAAIKCEDTFYRFGYNKVYTTGAHIDRFKFGWNRASHYGIKEITDRACMSENNRFPMNDAQRNFDFLNFVFGILLNLMTPVLVVLIPIMHVLALLYPILYALIEFVRRLVNGIIWVLCKIVDAIPFVNANCSKETIRGIPKENPFKRLTLPMMTYPDCEACSCAATPDIVPEGEELLDAWEETAVQNQSVLANLNDSVFYETIDPSGLCYGNDEEKQLLASWNRTLFSGWDGTNPQDLVSGWGDNQDRPNDKWFKSPLSIQSNNSLVDGKSMRAPYDVSWPQAFNAINQRDRYFSNTRPNRIQTTIMNSDYGSVTVNQSNNQFTDLPLITLVDADTSLTPGQLVSFTDSLLIPDPNTTGLTANQYGDTSITGTLLNNTSAYVPSSITYEKSNGVVQSVNLDLKSTETGASYKFKSGVEYFQVIGTMKLSEAVDYLDNNASSSEKNNSLIYTYILEKVTRYMCQKIVVFGGLQTQVYSPKPIDYWDEDSQLVFLTRGVDPHTPRQTIRYDLGPLFGKAYGQAALQFQGEYFLNIPIQPTPQNDVPQRHFTPLNVNYNVASYADDNANSNTTLYHPSFLFTPDPTQYTPFYSTGPAYYNSMGPEWTTLNSVTYGTTNGVTVSNNTSITAGISQGRIAGCSYQYSRRSPGTVIERNGTNDDLYTVSPSYINGASGNIPKVNMSNPNRLIFRSDRLPTSTARELGRNTTRQPIQDFALHLNNNFTFFNVSDQGDATLQNNTSEGIEAGDATGNLNDYSGITPSVISGVLQSFTCEGLVQLKCYQGNGSNFSAPTDGSGCDAKELGKVVGGCYVFVESLLILTIPNDIRLLFEWKTRFKFMFATCRGVVGHMFQNNWVNGTLYMPSFQKRTFYDTNNEVKRYKYCGDPQQSTIFGISFQDRQYRGPIYFNTDSNSFFYRSTPYYNGDFVGQTTKSGLSYIGSNDSQIWQPTTIMDLGPKTDFLKEILLTPEFQGYIMDKVESTSYQDESGILNLFVISRLIDSNFFQQILGIGGSAVAKLFSRQTGGFVGTIPLFDSRVDGDYAQLISINSEFGVLPYLPGNYSDSITVGDGKIGIWFTGDTADRRILGPGEVTFSESPLITNQFNYPGTQVVPFYRWKTTGTKLFGNEDNKWVTNSGVGQTKSGLYQDETFDGSNYYPKTTVLSESTGYLTNVPGFPDGANSPNDSQAGGVGAPSYRVGSPFQSYFGLKRGKSAMNKFITKYIFNEI